MPRTKPAVFSKDDLRAATAKLWRAFMKNPSEPRHEALWRQYQPLVQHAAERFNDQAGGTYELAALIDAGNVGLLDALAEFKPAADARFETLAVPMIRQAMARSLAVQRAKKKGHVLRMELADAIAKSENSERRLNIESRESARIFTKTAKAFLTANNANKRE